MSTTVLQTIDLTKRFGSLVAVKGLSLEVFAGEVFGFLGPNGAGKTTSINMMCGLLKPDAGQVLVHGKPVVNGDARTRAKVGMCPQNIVLWERLTCLEQLQFIGEMYGLRGSEARRRGERLLEELDLAEKQNKQARTLSGGMQRRLNLAMALVHEPEILVLDEPEAGLDPQSRVKVREYIHSQARKRTVILTTHNMDEADRVVDRLAIIDHGELLVVDTPEALKQRLGLGDVVEIRLSEEVQVGVVDAVQQALTAFSHAVSDLSYDAASRSLRVRALHVVAHLPLILDALHAAGQVASEINIRSNTLEDVFIQLTGRSLRE
jgi:ABC-2 type transport system ATP-binding protein